MRKVTFSGTRMGLSWSESNAGVIRSDSLIAEVEGADLVAGPLGQRLLRQLTTAAGAGARVVITFPHTPDPDTLRKLDALAGEIGVRCVVLRCPLPAAESAEMDALVEELRTAQDVLTHPLAIDPVFDPVNDPAQAAAALREACERAWCTFVLDLSNIHDYALAAGVDPQRVASDLPPIRVVYVRVRSSTDRPVSSSVKSLVLATMSRWDVNPPAIVLHSSRPVSASLRELSELLAVSGHEIDADAFGHLDVAVRAGGLKGLG